MKKANLNFLVNLNANDILTCEDAGDKINVNFILKDGVELDLPVAPGYDDSLFYDVIERITGTVEEKTPYISIDAYVTRAKSALLLRDIRNILIEEGSDADPADIKAIMLDRFRGKNLVKKAEQEGNLKKYVQLALNKFNELGGKVDSIYD